jgi:hypothetical protein
MEHAIHRNAPIKSLPKMQIITTIGTIIEEMQGFQKMTIQRAIQAGELLRHLSRNTYLRTFKQQFKEGGELHHLNISYMQATTYIRLYENRELITECDSIRHALEVIQNNDAKSKQGLPAEPRQHMSAPQRITIIEADEFKQVFNDFISAGKSANNKQEFGMATSNKGVKPTVLHNDTYYVFEWEFLVNNLPAKKPTDK